MHRLELACCTHLTDEGLRSLSNLPMLATLNLTWCRQITDRGIKALTALPALTSLQMLEINITSAGIKSLAAIPTLTNLDLWACQRLSNAGKVNQSTRSPLYNKPNLCPPRHGAWSLPPRFT